MRSLVRSMLFFVLVLACGVQAFAQCPNDFALLSPANGATNVPLTPTFEWAAVTGTTQYDIFIAPTGQGACSFSSNPASSSTTDFNPPPLQPGTTYEWRVRVQSGTCAGVQSASCFTFTTRACPTVTPTLTAPADNAQLNFGNVTLEWSDVPDAQGYAVYGGLDGDTPGLITTTIDNTLTLQIEPGRTVTWYVKAKAAGCTDLASSPRTFTTNCPTTAPTPQAPNNGATFGVGQSVTFTWIPIAGATSYDVNVADDGSSFAPIGENIVGNSFSHAFNEAGDFEWEVRANFDGDCDPLFSERREIVIGATCTGNIPAELIAPANSATARVPVTFQWTERAGADGYVLIAHRAGDRLPRVLANTRDTQFTATDLDGGTYDWWVVTQYPNCPDAKSEERILTIESDCPDDKTTLLEPADGAANVESPIEFKWTPVAGARAYRLFAAIDGANPVLLATTEDTEVEAAVVGGGVIWSVQTIFNEECSTFSETSRFTIARIECPAAEINLTAPANGATVTSPVRVAWSAVAGATSYGVWVSLDNSAPLNIARTEATETTINLPAGSYRWYVDARRGDDCRGVVSDEGSFTVQRAANCDQNAAPTVVSPLGGTVQSPVTLSWTSVANAIAYRVWIGRNGAFEDVGLTKNNTLTIEVEVAGNYAWFVQALFDGCEPENSNRGAFVIVSDRTCPTQAPVITAPANDANVSSPVNILWTAVAGAEKYRVFALKDDAEEPVLIGVTEHTELERTLPPGTYEIAVEAVIEECPSTFSQRVRFTVPRAQNCNTNAAQPITPANGATGINSPVTFTWNGVDGASGYVLVARVNGGSPTALEATEETTASHEMPPGRIEWWVVKFAPGCDPVESQHFVFEIPRTSTECDNRRPILLLPGEHSGGVHSPVFLAWTAVPDATGYEVWARRGDVDPNLIATTTESKALVDLPEGTYEWFVIAKFASCNPTRSARGEFTVDPPVPCGTPAQPLAQVVGQALSNTRYRVRWTPVANAAFYEIQEATTLDFANATTFTTDEPFLQFNHEVTAAPVQYLYRVRAISDCSDARGPYSDTVGVFVIAPRTNNASAEIGTEGNVVQTVFLPGGTTPLQFSVTTDKPWLTVTPSAGTLPVEGLTLTVTASRNILALGTNTATIKITYSGGSFRSPQTHAGTITSIPLSVSLVTPVVPTGKGTPPPDSLIFPVVGHAQGANDSLFESDIRVTNLTAQTMKYQLNLTPSGTNGTTTGSSSTVEIAPNQTLALDDVVASLFGTGTTSSATGMLEVRPLTTSAPATPSFFGSTTAGQTIKNLMTAASSRTYNFTPNGTFGQFIPAIRYADFVGKAAPGLAPTILSLQQVAQSQAYRANFGFAEASGKPAELMVRVYDTASTLLATIPVSLQAGEHKQLNGMLATNGINDLANGRVEVEVLSGDGKVTAYVSEVDNKTNDPLLVSAVVKGATTSNRYVVPGVAFLTNASANWVSDLRIFNAGVSTPATLTFYPQGNPSATVTRDIQLDAGEIEVLDNVLGDLFAQANGAGGSIAVTTPGFSQLTATARTYNSTTNGTYGQYIPGVTPAESVGASDRALQILQLEQSSRLRTNIGLAETSGQTARVEVSVIVPDSIATPVVTIDLQPNEFRQITLGPGGFGLDGVYNARVTVKVVSGNGRVTAYGSAIDVITQDPTYVTAQ